MNKDLWDELFSSSIGALNVPTQVNFDEFEQGARSHFLRVKSMCVRGDAINVIKMFELDCSSLKKFEMQLDDESNWWERWIGVIARCRKLCSLREIRIHGFYEPNSEEVFALATSPFFPNLRLLMLPSDSIFEEKPDPKAVANVSKLFQSPFLTSLTFILSYPGVGTYALRMMGEKRLYILADPLSYLAEPAPDCFWWLLAYASACESVQRKHHKALLRYAQGWVASEGQFSSEAIAWEWTKAHILKHWGLPELEKAALALPTLTQITIRISELRGILLGQEAVLFQHQGLLPLASPQTRGFLSASD